MNYLKSALMTVAVSLLGGRLLHTIALTNLAMLYILVVVITAIKWGRGPSIFSAVFSVLIFDFFFVPPKYSLTVAHTQYLIAFATLFIVGLVISTLALRAKEQAQSAKNREAQTRALYNLSKDLVKANEYQTLFALVVEHVRRMFGAESAVFIRSEDGLKTGSPVRGFPPDEAETKAAHEVMKSGKASGWDAPSGSPVRTIYLPLKTAEEPLGVIGVKFGPESPPLHPEQRRLLETFANQIAFAFERLRLAEEAGQASLLREAERLQTAFLNSVSHDLRTPLASISGSLSSLLQYPGIGEADRRTLLETASEEAGKLNQLVGGLLDMARVEAGALRILRKPVDVSDLVRTALENVRKTIDGFQVTVTVPEELPEAAADFPLMLRVIENILDNAAKYSSEDRKIIDISIRTIPDEVEISVADRGWGIPPADLDHVFEKFYRIRRPRGREGTGLGLSVCKGIVEAHGGRIWAESREGGGTIIRLTLPAEAEKSHD